MVMPLLSKCGRRSDISQRYKQRDNKNDKSNSLASQRCRKQNSARILNGPCDKKDNVEKKVFA